MASQPPTKLTSSSKLSAWVTVDDVPVPVYQVEESGNKVTCFIEAVEDKEFKVGFENVGFSWFEVVVDVFLDGKLSAGMISRSQFKPDMLEGRPESSTTIRPFAFAKLATTDDADLATTDKNFIENLGTIQITVRRFYDDSTASSAEEEEGVKNQVVHESKKAILSHQANLGQVKAMPHVRSARVKYVDRRERPVQIFEFKYRSRALLELQNVVEPAPAPSQAVAGPSTSSGNKRKASTPAQDDKDGVLILSSDDDSGDEDGMLVLLAKRAQLDAKIARRKKRREEEPGSKKVKKESGSMKVEEEPASKKVEKEALVVDLLGESPSEE
ncbi:hypothetical protein JCM1840_004894 [Sporobolomyces johnsonii]